MSNSIAAQLSDNLAEILAAHADSVVSVHARRAPTSGVVWSSDGHVLVTAHALEREDDLAVTLADGSRRSARLLGRDGGTDLALLALDPPGAAPPAASGPALRPASFEPQSELRVGHLALTISRPGRTARGNLSLLSAVGEGWRGPQGGRIDRYLELGGGIYSGLSGSLVVDMRGRAIGLATAGLLRGTANVIPAETLTRVVESLRAKGSVPRGYLGVSSYPIRLPAAEAKALGQSTALLIVAVEPNSPAARAGLFLGDAILALDGQKLSHAQELLGLLDEEKVGKESTLRILRTGAAIEVRCVIGARENAS